MKTYLIHILLLVSLNLSCFFIYSQGFEKHYPTKYSVNIGPVLEFDSGYIVITNRIHVPTPWGNARQIDLMVYKISLTGKLLDSLNISDNDSVITHCFVATIVDNSVLAFATIRDTNTGCGKGLYFSFDFNMNVIKRKVLDITPYSPQIFSVYYDTDSSIYLSGNNTIPSNGAIEPFVLIMSAEGLIKKMVKEDEHTSRIAKLIYLPEKDEFRLATSNSLWYYSKDLESDSLIWYKPDSNLLVWMESTLLLDDTTLAITGHILTPSVDFSFVTLDIGFVKRSINGEFIANYQYGAIDSSDQVNPYSMDFVNSDSIYISCMSNPGGILWTSADGQDAWISLYNVNSSGSVNWVKYYGTDAQYLWPQLIITKDHGCLIACERYAWPSLWPNYKSDLYLIKTDRYGNSSAVGIAEPLLPGVARVYDDYSSKSIVVEVSQSCTINLYDITGRLVIQQNLSDGTNQISTIPLKKGIYIYSVIFSNKPPASGKLVIQ
jgi:hypothetical protein